MSSCTLFTCKGRGGGRRARAMVTGVCGGGTRGAARPRGPAPPPPPPPRKEQCEGGARARARLVRLPVDLAPALEAGRVEVVLHRLELVAARRLHLRRAAAVAAPEGGGVGAHLGARGAGLRGPGYRARRPGQGRRGGARTASAGRSRRAARRGPRRRPRRRARATRRRRRRPARPRPRRRARRARRRRRARPRRRRAWQAARAAATAAAAAAAPARRSGRRASARSCCYCAPRRGRSPGGGGPAGHSSCQGPDLGGPDLGCAMPGRHGGYSNCGWPFPGRRSWLPRRGGPRHRPRFHSPTRPRGPPTPFGAVAWRQEHQLPPQRGGAAARSPRGARAARHCTGTPGVLLPATRWGRRSAPQCYAGAARTRAHACIGGVGCGHIRGPGSCQSVCVRAFDVGRRGAAGAEQAGRAGARRRGLHA